MENYVDVNASDDGTSVRISDDGSVAFGSAAEFGNKTGTATFYHNAATGETTVSGSFKADVSKIYL